MMIALRTVLLLAIPAFAFADSVRELASLDTANDRVDFERQVKDDSSTFRSLQGLTSFVPGFSWDELRMYFVGTAGSKMNEDTSDALEFASA